MLPPYHTQSPEPPEVEYARLIRELMVLVRDVSNRVQTLEDLRRPNGIVELVSSTTPGENVGLSNMKREAFEMYLALLLSFAGNGFDTGWFHTLIEGFGTPRDIVNKRM